MLKKLISILIGITLITLIIPTKAYAKELSITNTSKVVNVNKKHTATLMYNGQYGQVTFNTTGSYRLNQNNTNIWITNINLNTNVIYSTARWKVKVDKVEYNSLQRTVKVFIRVSFIGDDWDSPLDGWHYDAIEYQV